jgi:hypothetical protein
MRTRTLDEFFCTHPLCSAVLVTGTRTRVLGVLQTPILLGGLASSSTQSIIILRLKRYSSTLYTRVTIYYERVLST